MLQYLPHHRRTLSALALVLGLTWSSQLVSAQDSSGLTDAARGRTLYEQGKTQAAVTLLQRGTKQDPNDADGWHFLGLALYRLDKENEARKAFEQAIKLRPGFAPSHSGLASVLLKQNKLLEAEGAARAAVAIDEKNAMAHYLLGAVNLQQGRAETALREADIALGLSPTPDAALLLRADSLMALFDQHAGETTTRPDQPAYRYLKEAAQALETYFRQHPNEPKSGRRRQQLDLLQPYLQLPDTLADYDPNAVYEPDQGEDPL